MQLFLDAFNALTATPATSAGVVFLFGLLVGSFLNVVIHRLPVMMERAWKRDCAEMLGQAPDPELEKPYDLIRPGSQCPGCGKPIRAWQNIPVVSFLIQRGRCAACSARISWQYPLVELATGLLSAWVVLHFGLTAQGGFALLLTWALIALTVIDFRTQLLPDAITLPLLWLGLLISLWGVFVPVQDALIGAMAGYLSLWSIYHLFRLATGKEGMGYGDFKLLAALGAWLGWQQLPVIILLSSVVGTVIGLGLILFKRQDRSVPIAFGPFIAIAGWIALLWGNEVMTAYLGTTGL